MCPLRGYNYPMSKRNWNVIVVVPGRVNSDGTETQAAYFSGKREDAKLVGMKPIAPVEFVSRKRTGGK